MFVFLTTGYGQKIAANTCTVEHAKISEGEVDSDVSYIFFLLLFYSPNILWTDLSAGHVKGSCSFRAPYKFSHFSPTDSPYRSVRAVMTNALLTTGLWHKDTVRQQHPYIISAQNLH